MKNLIFKIQCTMLAVVLIALICVVDYGLDNDCPNTQGFVSCAARSK